MQWVQVFRHMPFDWLETMALKGAGDMAKSVQTAECSASALPALRVPKAQA